MESFLDLACAQARERVAEARGLVGDPALRERALATPAPPSLAAALAGPGTAVIAELKRASPSAGHLAWLPDPLARARAYLDGGAAAVSVLTEPAHFHGTLADLAVVAAGTDAPTIRKDFLVDAYQVWEARASGAAAVLLIVAALDDVALASLLAEVGQAGLEALVEVHDVAEAERAGAALAAAPPATRPVVGVNARDLATLEVDPARFAACVEALPEGALAVAESGVAAPADLARVAAAGADAALVGTQVVTAVDPAAEVRSLVAAGRGERGHDPGRATLERP